VENVRPEPPTSPERIGRYQLVGEIGGGPLGPLSAAYVAAGAEEGRIVAIRRVPVGANEREAQQRISRSGIGAMSIRHARLAAVLDVLPGPSSLAVVSEYVESASLRSLQRQAAISRAPLPPPVAVAIAADVLRALRAAGDLWRELASAARDSLAASAHGGLLPDSVTVASFGETMLADLGVAGAAATIPAILRHPEALPYRSPEQLAGEALDQRTDVYTLGVLLWEMLANRPLFGSAERLRKRETARALDDVEREILAGNVPRLDRVERAGAPIQPMLVEITHEALARDRDRRFPTLDAMLDAMRTLARDAIAQPEQVSVALDRLVRSELDARRVAIELVAGFDRVSAMPESARSTARPPAPLEPVRFAISEAPTARRRQTPRPNSVAAVGGPKAAPPPALGRITAGATKPSLPRVQAATAPMVEPIAAKTKPSERPAPVESTGSGVRATASRESLEPPGGLALTPAADVADQAPTEGPHRRGRGLLLVAIIAAAALLGLVMVRGLSRTATPSAERPEPSAAGPSVATEAPPSVSPAAEPPEPTPTGSAPASPPPSTPGPPPGRAVEPPRGLTPAAPATGKKPFRPRGI
jgi:eukaryotic-like serine/threonine-protein kinase